MFPSKFPEEEVDFLIYAIEEEAASRSSMDDVRMERITGLMDAKSEIKSWITEYGDESDMMVLADKLSNRCELKADQWLKDNSIPRAAVWYNLAYLATGRKRLYKQYMSDVSSGKTGGTGGGSSRDE